MIPFVLPEYWFGWFGWYRRDLDGFSMFIIPLDDREKHKYRYEVERYIESDGVNLPYGLCGLIGSGFCDSIDHAVLECEKMAGLR